MTVHNRIGQGSPDKITSDSVRENETDFKNRSPCPGISLSGKNVRVSRVNSVISSAGPWMRTHPFPSAEPWCRWVITIAVSQVSLKTGNFLCGDQTGNHKSHLRMMKGASSVQSESSCTDYDVTNKEGSLIASSSFIKNWLKSEITFDKNWNSPRKWF